MQVTIYTDGAARGNPDGPGGYGAIVQYRDENGDLMEKDVRGLFFPIPVMSSMPF